MERTQEELRPVGHPLHQRVEDHQRQGGSAQRDAAGETLKDSVGERTAFNGLCFKVLCNKCLTFTYSYKHSQMNKHNSVFKHERQQPARWELELISNN